MTLDAIELCTYLLVDVQNMILVENLRKVDLSRLTDELSEMLKQFKESHVVLDLCLQALI